MPDETCSERPSHHPSRHAATALAPDPQEPLQSLEDLLSQADSEAAVSRAARLRGDARLVDYLRRQDFSGPQYQQFIQRLMEYGWRTLISWSADGVIFERTARAGRPVPAHMVQTSWGEHERSQVVTDTVLKGTIIFREHGLVRAKWNAAAGAGLPTYFVGASILAFRPVYIRWFNDHRLGQAELDRGPADADDGPHAHPDIPDQRATDPAKAATTYDDIAHLRQQLPDSQLREALSWIAFGYSHAQAAQLVGLTPKALERRLARARARITDQGPHQAHVGEGGAR